MKDSSLFESLKSSDLQKKDSRELIKKIQELNKKIVQSAMGFDTVGRV